MLVGLDTRLNVAFLASMMEWVDKPECRPSKEISTLRDDAMLSLCSANFNVFPYEFARDKFGRERFYPASPSEMYNMTPLGGTTHQAYSLGKKFSGGFQTGEDCCSTRSISFHHMQPAAIRSAHNILYSCRRQGWTQTENTLDNEAQRLRIFDKAKADFTIVVLTMNRELSLTRLIRSLQVSEYGNDRVDLLVRFDRPGTDVNEWEAMVKRFGDELHWRFGRVNIFVSEKNLGLAQAWFNAWTPSSDEDRAIIFEDDIEVSPHWYTWLKGAFEAYNNRTDLAAISLQRQQLVPLKSRQLKASVPENDHIPFLYRLLGSHGFAPLASVWQEFLDFVDCAVQTNLDVSTSELITSDWYKSNKRDMWTQHFIYFSQKRDLYNLYLIPKNSKALAAHWQEKGAHFDGTSRKRDFELVDKNDILLEYPTQLNRFDWGAEPEIEVQTKSVIMSTAVGYEKRYYEKFIGNLRSVYRGHIWLLIDKDCPRDIRYLLKKHNVKTVESSNSGNYTRETREWDDFNRYRFKFYRTVCNATSYNQCMALDFRDVLFQDDPFRTFGQLEGDVMFVYEHEIRMNDWHFGKMKLPRCGMYDKYGQVLSSKFIINAGSLIGTPSVFKQLVELMFDTLSGCNDQVALNIGVYGKLLNASVISHRTGDGNINVVGYAKNVIRDRRGRFLNNNCAVSPVVHQYDEIARIGNTIKWRKETRFQQHQVNNLPVGQGTHSSEMPLVRITKENRGVRGGAPALSSQHTQLVAPPQTATTRAKLLDRLDIGEEWTPASIPDSLKVVDSNTLQASISKVAVKIPGLEHQDPFFIPFFKARPAWLSTRTFTSYIFFCPPNGHEGTITHLIGQLLSSSAVGSFVDVGSNLGFYSLLAMDMNVPAYAFDIQPFCLYNLYSLAQTSPRRNQLHLFNVGLSDAAQVVTNSEGGCDYENFYVTDNQTATSTAVSADKAGMGIQVRVVRFDDWMAHMENRLSLPIRVLKMDTEGAEGRIVLGMGDTLAASPCILQNWIVELTPAHWYRFGQSMEDATAIQAYVDVVEKHGYRAYLMYMQPERRPPASMHDFMKPLSVHPAMPSQANTGCDGAPYFEILDMRRFFFDYCIQFQSTVKRPGGSAKGYCGNVWFQKQGCSE